MYALRHHFPGNDDRGSPAFRGLRHSGEPFEGRTKVLILMIAYPRSARAEVEDKKVPTGAKFDFKVFSRTDNEALNNIVLPHVRHARPGRLRRDVR